MARSTATAGRIDEERKAGVKRGTGEGAPSFIV
jgi:hypothetical protein